MKRILAILVEITIDILRGASYFIQNNLRNLAWLLDFLQPYVMYFVGQYVYSLRGEYAVGSELFIPLAFVVISYYTRSTANKLGKGVTIPIPHKRFTQVDEDGMVSVEHKRLQEMLLYVADVEDWLERKGLL